MNIAIRVHMSKFAVRPSPSYMYNFMEYLTMSMQHFANFHRFLPSSPQFYYMMTSSNGNIFALLAICTGNSPVTGEFPAQRPVTQSFDIFFDLRLNKRLSKQSWGLWFETLSRSLWRHGIVFTISYFIIFNLFQESRFLSVISLQPIGAQWHHKVSQNMLLISSGNGLSPVRSQAITRINVDLMLIWNRGTNNQRNFDKM